MMTERTGPKRALHELLGASRALFHRRDFFGNSQFVRRGRVQWGRARRGLYRISRIRWVRRIGIGAAIGCGVVGLLIGVLLWRLASGPIALDIVTPWLRAAIEENFGARHQVSIGGTQIEREQGRTSLRIRDIVVRDANGTTVAAAPKAEVGISGSGLLTGKLRAQSLNLVGAELAVRIETDGRLTVFTGPNSAPIATAPIAGRSVRERREGPAMPADPLRGGLEEISTLLAWLDELGATGLDGHDLHEIGLKSGSLTVDDRRNGKQWAFREIDVTLRRPQFGGLILRLASEDKARPWEISAALRPLSGGVRAVGIEARKVSLNDILLISRVDKGAFDADVALSASVRAEFLANGTLQAAGGQIVGEPGEIKSPDDSEAAIEIRRADIRFNWDGERQVLVVPFQIQTAGNQFTLIAQMEPDTSRPGVWLLTAARGDPVIDPVILAAQNVAGDERLALNRFTLRARLDTANGRFVLDQVDLGRNDVRPTYNFGVALSGAYDYAAAEPRVGLGVAGTRMPIWVMRRLWPVVVAPHARDWVERRISGGTVERVVIALNASAALLNTTLPLPDEGVSVDVETSGTILQPIPTLPPIRDADLVVRATGRTANVALGRGTIEVAPGRRLSIASGTFEVPDTHPKGAPALARFRIDGAVPAAALLLQREPLKSATGIAIDPATSRGTMAAQIALELKLDRDRAGRAENYSVAADLTNFAAEKLFMGQKIEASALRLTANGSGYQIRGDARINGTPATLDFRKAEDSTDSEIALQATLDEAARRRLGIDFGPTVAGSVPVKLTGRIAAESGSDRFNVEADFTQARIDNLLPGWTKTAGRPARATFVFNKDAKTTRFEDLTIEGSGTLAKGAVELDNAGEILTANFPVFAMADGDRVSIKAERGNDAAMHVTMRGDVYDGRNFIKTAMANVPATAGRQKQQDIELDVKLGVVAGHNGEALRGLELKLSRRAGRIRNFNLNAKIGRDTPLIGDLRVRPRDNHPVVYLETNDAGSLFRFTDTYARMMGGQMWLAMDPPTADQTPQIGLLAIRNFSVRDEPSFSRVLGNANQARASVDFTELRCDFTRLPGRMIIREGVVRGPVVGGTIDGQIDYERNELRMRGTFVPLYGINNMFGQIPIVGLFLGGGSNEGLLGMNYEATGPTSAPRVTINPVSAIAPGLLRKLMPGPGMMDPNFTPPSR